jgi:hypothetical protein
VAIARGVFECLVIAWSPWNEMQSARREQLGGCQIEWVQAASIDGSWYRF